MENKENVKTPLITKMQNLRHGASLVYDKAIASGIKQEEIQNLVEPIQKQLNGVVDEHVNTDIQGCIDAMLILELEAGSFKKMTEFYITKEMNTRQLRQSIENKIIKRMEEAQTEQMTNGSSSITLQVVGEKKRLIFR